MASRLACSVQRIAYWLFTIDYSPFINDKIWLGPATLMPLLLILLCFSSPESCFSDTLLPDHLIPWWPYELMLLCPFDFCPLRTGPWPPIPVNIIPYFYQKFNDYLTKITKKTPKKHLFCPPFFLLKSELYPRILRFIIIVDCTRRWATAPQPRCTALPLALRSPFGLPPCQRP